MVDKLKEYEAGIAKEQREAFTPKWITPDEVDGSKCLHCGEGEPLYCENCFQDLISQNVKLQMENIQLCNDINSRGYWPNNPMKKYITTDSPLVDIPKWPGTCKPEDIRWGMDLGQEIDKNVEELTQWKKEDKPEPNLECLMQMAELDEDTVEAVREYVKEYTKQQAERADEINEGRGV